MDCGALGLGDDSGEQVDRLTIDRGRLVEIGKGIGEREFSIPVEAAENDLEQGECHAAEFVVIAVPVDAPDKVGLGDAVELSCGAKIDEMGDFHAIAGGDRE
jgi:hypothetical protein